jgi:hypothetical protein
MLDICHVADILPTCQQVTCCDISARYPCRQLFADMSADLSATRRPDRHMSVVLTLVSTRRHPTLPAEPTYYSDFIVMVDLSVLMLFCIR